MTLDQVFHGEGVMGPWSRHPSPAGKKLLRKGFLTSGSGVGSLWTCSEHMPPLPRHPQALSFFPEFEMKFSDSDPNKNLFEGK